MYIHKQNQNSPRKIKFNRLTWRTKKTKNYIYQLRTKLTKVQTGKQNQSKMPTGEYSKENKITKQTRWKKKKESKPAAI